MSLPVLEETGEPAAPPPEPIQPRRRKAPAWLWVAGVAILIPIAVPLAFLFADVIGATDAAWDVLFSSRTLELLIRSILFTAAKALRKPYMQK